MNIIKTIVVAAAVVLGMAMGASAADKVKVGFVYVGPIGDHGWTYRHDIGRQQIEEAYGDKVETFYAESVQYGPDSERVIRQMAKDGADIIFEGALANAFETTLTVAEPTADRTITLPNQSGTVAMDGDALAYSIVFGG